jgi:hypothetical protein
MPYSATRLPAGGRLINDREINALVALPRPEREAWLAQRVAALRARRAG